ncbi:Cyclin-dependent protein kinase [Dermatophagoides pteronyssinus]|uniref:Protein CNPPD1 n=1 Tax=Dermatophagoides pteronyssinus TaxID=6956 RepID=A0ABQ8ITS0_DERPT|nr:Cyclin-dependent protein kinase [Dermatophagoides pteronyssinus]
MQKRLGKLDINYASFILHQAALSPASVILAMIYLDRLKKMNSTYLDRMTSSELFVASLVVATKFLYDKGGADMVYNDEWATFANIDLEDLNQLERDFLDAIQWSCYVRPETFMEQMIKMEGLISLNEYRKRNRNTMTYMEMISSFKYLRHFYDKDNELLWSNLVTLINGILICTAAYAIAIGVVIASTSLVATAVHRNLNDNDNQNHSISTFIVENDHRILSEFNWTTNTLGDDNDLPISISKIFLSTKNFLTIRHHNKHQQNRRKYPLSNHYRQQRQQIEYESRFHIIIEPLESADAISSLPVTRQILVRMEHFCGSLNRRKHLPFIVDHKFNVESHEQLTINSFDCDHSNAVTES